MVHLITITIDRHTGQELKRTITPAPELTVDYRPLYELLYQNMIKDGLIPAPEPIKPLDQQTPEIAP